MSVVHVMEMAIMFVADVASVNVGLMSAVSSMDMLMTG